MKKVLNLSMLLFLFLIKISHGQIPRNNSGTISGSTQKSFHTKWTTSPFDNQIFIENKGQFDKIIPDRQKVYYAANLGDIEAFFTSNGIIYRMEKYPKPDVSKGQDPDKNGPPKAIIKYLYSEWKGGTSNTLIKGSAKQSYYYTYPSGLSSTIKTDVYKKITYYDIYPGIDIEYSFKKGKPGIEYKLIIHPGADISLARLLYKNGAKKSNMTANGAIEAQTNMGIFTMSTPKGFYINDSTALKVSYFLKGNEESFSVVNKAPDKTYVIDPWITDPQFTNADEAYDVDYDNYGNVYAYGGTASTLLQFVKINSLGVIQWTFNAANISTDYYGGFCTDKVTGTSYLVQGYPGGIALKVNTLGALVGTFLGDTRMVELWRAKFDACNGNIVIAGGGTSGTYQAGVLDSDMSSINPVNVLGAPNAFHDMALLTIDPDGNQCYMASAYSVFGDHSVGNNMLMQLPLPSLSPTAYQVHERLGFQEVSSVFYVNGGYDNGFNGAAASPNWLYLYNGDTLSRYHKNTGAFVSSYSIRLNSPFQYGGLDVDPCNNLFVGVEDSIYVLDSSYAMQNKIALQDTVFDVLLGQNGALYACGVGYVTQIVNPVTPTLISSATGTPSSCSACNGTATVNINCGVAPYLFRWNDDNTNQTDTGLCPGVYTVTVTDAACPPHADTAIINVTGENGFSAFISDTNPDCGLKKGNATIHVTGGVPRYAYNWNNGSTNQTDTGLVAGTYVCVVTDDTGCIYKVGITLVNPTAPKVKILPALDSICIGSSLKLTASGAKTYVWASSPSLSCDSCPTPIATPTITTTFTVTGTDSLGCTAFTISTIKVSTMPNPIITGKDSVCSGYTDTLSVTGGNTYLWSTGATTTSINYHSVGTQTITVTAHNGVCLKDTSFVIHVVSPAAKITASADSVCANDSVLLTGSGGATYKWNTGKTTTGIWVTIPSTKTYTLYAYAGTCKDSAIKTINILSKVTAAISAVNDTVCPLGGPTTLTASGLGGKVSGYRWNTGATASFIQVSDSVTTTYTVTVYGVCDSSQKTMQVVVIPLAKPLITGTGWKCKGQKDTLFVSSANSPTYYLWNNGETTTTIITGDINADSIFTLTASNSLGCPVTITDTVLLRQPPKVIANPPAIFCAGQAITLTASATGSNPPFTYTWSTGQTGTSITINPGPDSTTTYTVYAFNGCKSPATTTTAIPNVPILGACCSQTLFINHDTAILVASGNSYKYQWIDSNQVVCLNPPLCDSVRVNPAVTTSYTVIGTDSNGCQTEKVILISIEVPCFDLIIPNVFTPTNAGLLGLDNVFYIKTQNMDAWSLTIYDRWGKEMFHTTNPYDYWNGNTEGGAVAPAGVYYYIIDGTCQNNTYKKDGFVQLIR